MSAEDGGEYGGSERMPVGRQIKMYGTVPQNLKRVLGSWERDDLELSKSKKDHNKANPGSRLE